MNFQFKITYFKPSGKYYSDHSVEWNIRNISQSDAPPLPAMYDAAAKIRGLRDTGGQGAMPGLSGEGWEGFILLECSEGFPVLILPRT